MPIPPSAPPVPADVIAIEQALTRITYLAGRARQHERLMALVGLPLDRAAVAILRYLGEEDLLRPGVLAVRLSVEASHVTRQLRQLETAGFVIRVPDPEDRRAQLIQLTEAGQAAVDRIREVGHQGMRSALAHWSPDDLRRLSGLFHRLVDDFVAHAEVPVEGASEV
ncbi:MarR family transcriptional regulator [Streptomyces sp. NBC_01275]|uniref:MarR family winged helix-turn-helix transcriptional regulator n=1 Tax=Streptomyces sp. NBC_01275 TaxID=2903807 RepID=UPI00225B9A5B|nr:MarR family transcriptional regulator [Streptomyces sp. NBC_01275]MCX4763586.1 MarR family transcriptional regulator [Streptomyces sp. NBC_01275]